MRWKRWIAFAVFMAACGMTGGCISVTVQEIPAENGAEQKAATPDDDGETHENPGVFQGLVEIFRGTDRIAYAASAPAPNDHLTWWMVIDGLTLPISGLAVGEEIKYVVKETDSYTKAEFCTYYDNLPVAEQLEGGENLFRVRTYHSANSCD